MKISKQLEMFNEEHELIEFGISVLTFNVTSGPWKNRLLIVLVAVISLFTCYCAISHLNYAMPHGLNMNFITSLMVFFGYFQMSGKILMGSFEKQSFQQLFDWISSLYKHRESDPVLQLIMEKHLVYSIKTWKFLLKWVGSAFLATSLLTALNMRPDSLGFVIRIPFLEPHIFYEEIVFLAQILLVVVASRTMILIDSSVFFVGLHVMAALNILRDCIEILNMKIAENADYFKTILKYHNDVIENICVLNEAIEKISFVQILSGTVLIIGNFFLIRKESDQMFAYILCVCMLGQIFLLCLFGEFIKIKLDKLSTTLYMTNWYELSVKDQKTFLIILAMAQRQYGLKAAGMYDVNIYAFIQRSSFGNCSESKIFHYLLRQIIMFQFLCSFFQVH
ncbi:odorant receptor 4-like [Phlebotomus argentipes]|uniref:odorant receptor 4-like n=1 Tax=Phlebotomus argentipes TaxID=94469 RepID=UPI002892FCD0|nr:odorant receptor 4-like [Phlebotomus argentipes]